MNRKFESGKAYIPSPTVSQAVISGSYAFISGQISYDAGTGEYVKDGIAGQTRRVLGNIQGILRDMGRTLQDIVYFDITLSSMELFGEMDRAYAEFFPFTCPPARKTVASEIWGGMDIEISAIVSMTD